MRDKLIGTIFIIFIAITSLSQSSYIQFYKLGRSIASSTKTYLTISDESNDFNIEEAINASINEIDKSISDSLLFRKNLLRLNGRFLKTTGTRSYYNKANSINISKSGYDVHRYEETSTDYEVQQITSFKKYLDQKNISLLYVSEPTKYISDDYYTSEFGAESYINRNADKFLNRLKEANIKYLDIRDCIVDEGFDSMNMFYRTDHHWTVPTSQWAASKIAGFLNENYNYNIDLSLYDTDKYNVLEFKNSWLGEQGKKISDSYIGLDDYTMMEPKYDTSFSIISDDGTIIDEGTFDVFIDKSIYTDDLDVYDSPSWHYSYNSYNNSTIRNNNESYGNVLVIGDSYESSMAPFLALGIHNMKVIVPRSIEGSVRDIIDAGNYDTVIIAYTQFMIGAHDNESSANYRMFTLD